jgi:hypothetical protein
MSDQEYDVLDELYFIQSFAGLQQSCNLSEEELRHTLQLLWEKGWLRCMQSVEEDAVEDPDLKTGYRSYYYLASKAGLLAHNSR